MPIVGNVKQVNWGGKKAAEEQAAAQDVATVVGPAAGPTGPTGPMKLPEPTLTPPVKKRKVRTYRT